MLKFIYTQEPYGDRLFKEKMEINLCSDASLTDIIVTACKMANIATYHCDLYALKRCIKNLEEEGYKDWDRIL